MVGQRKNDVNIKLLDFHGIKKDDTNQHWLTYDSIWIVKKITYNKIKISHLETTFKYKALWWYMKYKVVIPIG